MSGFEGSFLGEDSRLAPDSLLECGVCWWVYDPALGDASWQIPPGTAFADLPSHWRCPNCDAARAQFMVLQGRSVASGEHPRPPVAAGLFAIRQRAEALRQAYTAVAERMVSLPVYNHRLDIRVIGLRRWTEGLVGVVATPWAMNIVLLPWEGAPARIEGTERQVCLPSGSYRFIAGQLAGVGALESCSLFSPMECFDDPEVVAEVAGHAVVELFRQPEPAAGERPTMSRRGFLRGGRGREEHSGEATTE